MKLTWRRKKENMHDFSWALAELKAGRHVTRKGWHGKGQYLGQQNPDAKSANTAPYIWIWADNKRTPWTASQADLQAKDWRVAKPTAFGLIEELDTFGMGALEQIRIANSIRANQDLEVKATQKIRRIVREELASAEARKQEGHYDPNRGTGRTARAAEHVIDLAMTGRTVVFVGKNVAHSQGLAEYITGAIEGRGLGYRQAIRREITLTTADGTRIANIYCAGMSEIEGKPPFGIKVYDHYCWE